MQIRRMLYGLVLATAPGLAQSNAFDTQRVIADPGVTRLTCTVRVMHGAKPLTGVGVRILTNGEGGREPVSTTDWRGRATVNVTPGTRYLPYIMRRPRPDLLPSTPDGPDANRIVRQKGFLNAALAAIPIERVPEFCRREDVEEVIELPDTLMRVRVTDAVEGEVVPGAAVDWSPETASYREWFASVDRGVVAAKASTGERGELEIPGLPPGRYEVRATDTNPPHIQESRVVESKARSIELREGDPVQVELTMKEVKPSPFPDIRSQALSGTNESRSMTEERFARVATEMTQEEVRAVLRQAPAYVREFDSGRMLAWAYPREEEGYVAVVFFNRVDDGSWRVHSVYFDVVTSGQPR